MEICHRHNIGRTEAEFEISSNGELFVQLEYIGSSDFQKSYVSITLSKDEVERLRDELDKYI